jgi:hypothetical protein
MKTFSCIMASAGLLLVGSVSHARGTPSSSFAPHGPEPHSSLSDKHHSSKPAKHTGTQTGSKKGSHSAKPKSGGAGHTPSAH